MADCEYTIAGDDRVYSESEFKKLLSEGYLDKVMIENKIKIRNVKPNEELAKMFQMPSTIKTQAPTETKDNYKIAQDVTSEVSRENPDASVLLTPKGEDLSLTAVYVGKENRGNGIGTKVLESVKKQADKLGKKIVLDATTELDEETDLGRLESFYQNNGFTKVGENKFEYNPATEVKTKETVTEEKSFDDKVAEEFAKTWRKYSFEENPKETINAIKNEIKYANLYDNGEISAKEYLEATRSANAKFGTGSGDKSISELSDEELKTFADTSFLNENINQAKQKVQSETVTKTEEKVTEPTAEKQPTRETQKTLLEESTDIINSLKDGDSFTLPNGSTISKNGDLFEFQSSEKGIGKRKIENKDDAIFQLNNKLSESRAGKNIELKNYQTEKTNAANLKVGDVYVRDILGTSYVFKLLEKPKVDTSKRNFYVAKVEVLSIGNQPTEYRDKDISSKIGKPKAFEKRVGGTSYDRFKAPSKDSNVFGNVKKINNWYSVSDTEVTTETKQPTREAVAAKNLADFLRTGKMEKGTAMALPLPGFDKLWNGTIETVAKAIEVGGVTAGNFRQSVEDGMKALKNTPAFKSITDPKERAKISREYKKQLLEKIPQFFNINTDDLRTGEFTDFNQKLEESKGKDLSTKELNKLKAEAKKFVTNNLPADKFRKSEVLSYVRNNFDKAKTVEDIQTNLDKVNNIMATKEAKIQKETEKQEAKDKKTLIKEIEGKIAANSRKVISKNRRTGAKKGKITLGSQQQINQLIQGLKDQGLFNNLDKMTDQELVTLNETIDNILTTGRVEQKQLNAIEEAKKRTDKAMILEALSDKPDKYLDGQEEIMQALDEESGIVIVDGQAMNKQAFEEYAKQNPDAELETVPFYYRRDAKEIKEDLKRDKTFRKGLRNITLFTVRDLETYIKKLGAGSKEFRTWLEESIAKPIREGRLKSVETVWNKTREYQKATKKIFGTDALGRNKMYDTLVEVTDIKPKNSKANLSAGQVVHLYGVLNNPDKDKAEANAKRLQKYNGISAKEVIDFMENPENKVLMDYYNFLKDKYNVEFRDEFGPSIEQLHNIVLEDKYYYPEPASGAATEAENILDLENKTVSLSAIAPNMRHRKDAVSVPFELVDAHEMFLRYVQSMAHAKEFIPATKAAYTLLSDMNKPYVMEKFGSVTEYNDFVKTLSIAVTDNTPYQTDAFTTVNNWTALTLLWFRLKAVPQQLSAFVHYYGAGIKDGVMPWDVARALPVTKNDFEFVKDFYFDNPYLYTRLSGGNITPEMQALKNQIDGNVNKYKRGILNAVQFVGLFPIKGGDAMSSASPGGGMSFALAQFRNKYNETGDYELSKQFAKQRWMEETERTQQPSLAKEAISTASYNNVVRLLIPFSSAQNAIAKKTYKAYIDIFKDWNSLNTNEKAQAVSDLVYYPVFGNMPFILTGGLGFALWRMLFDDEEEDTLKDAQKKRMYYDLAMEAIQSNATSAGVPGKIINTFINIARDKEFFNEVPLLQKGTDLSKLAYEVFLVDNDLSSMTKEQRLKFYQEHSGADDPLGRTEFSSEQEYNEWVENVYKPTPFYKKMTEKEIDLTKKVLGVKNLFTMIQDMKDFAASEKGISDIIELTTGAEQKRNELNKNLDPYFNQAIQFEKQDKLFEKIYDEDYVLKQIDEQQGVSTSKDIRSAIKALKPKKPKIPRPR